MQLPEEKNLIWEMTKFNTVAYDTLQSYRPSILTHYLYQLCQGFNLFYVNAPILKEKNELCRQARLALVECFVEVLRVALAQLGITPPQKM